MYLIFFFILEKHQDEGHKGQQPWYQRKGSVMRNTHVKYEISSTCHSKVIGKVKVSDRMTE